MLKENIQDQLINGQMEEVKHMIFQDNAVKKSLCIIFGSTSRLKNNNENLFLRDNLHGYRLKSVKRR